MRGKGPNYDCASDLEKNRSNKWIVIGGLFFWAIIWTVVFQIRVGGTDLPLLTGIIAVFLGMIVVYLGVNIVSVLMIMRQGIEHGHLSAEVNPLLRSKSTVFWPLYWLIPCGIGYHFEHHLNPNIPWYKLANAHWAIYHSIPDKFRSRICSRRFSDIKNQLIS